MTTDRALRIQTNWLRQLDSEEVLDKITSHRFFVNEEGEITSPWWNIPKYLDGNHLRIELWTLTKAYDNPFSCREMLKSADLYNYLSPYRHPATNRRGQVEIKGNKTRYVINPYTPVLKKLNIKGRIQQLLVAAGTILFIVLRLIN